MAQNWHERINEWRESPVLAYRTAGTFLKFAVEYGLSVIFTMAFGLPLWAFAVFTLDVTTSFTGALGWAWGVAIPVTAIVWCFTAAPTDTETA